MTYDDFEKIEIDRDYYVNTDKEFICEDENDAEEYIHECYINSHDCSYDEDDWKWMTGEELIRMLLKENYESKKSLLAQKRDLETQIKRLVKGE